MSSYEERAHSAWQSGDLAGAFRCLRLGASDGQHGCMMNLGCFYDEGIGTLRSKHEAMRWYKRAFANGYSGAASNIAILFRERGNHHHMFRWFIAAADAKMVMLLLRWRSVIRWASAFRGRR